MRPPGSPGRPTAVFRGIPSRRYPQRPGSVPEQFLQLVSRPIPADGLLLRRDEPASDKLEVLAVVGEVLLRHRLSPAITALLRNARVITHAIEADLQIRSTLMAGLGTARRAGQRVLSAAFPTMSCHCHTPKFTVMRGPYPAKNNPSFAPRRGARPVLAHYVPSRGTGNIIFFHVFA